ncbi:MULTISPECIES: hypothetical protein [unclassified Nostoc]|uniref:hypothetical protein n=1 Tax=unclassified Nostoc TaxID=2593658 RepID=UPI0026247ABB|nr:hypothetical protein [Nostoc sp. S13]MDF5736321.1 hypothetical protein [Nostoc sp. S13]
MKVLATFMGFLAGATLALWGLEAHPAQAATLSFDLTLIEDFTNTEAIGTFDIDDASKLSVGFVEITDFAITTPQEKSLTLANYVPSQPGFKLGFNPQSGFFAGVRGSQVFSPFIIKGLGSALFFDSSSNTYFEDPFSSTQTIGTYTATLSTPPVDVPEPGTAITALLFGGVFLQIKRKFG